MEDLLASIPLYAADLKINLTAVLQQPELTEQQTWGTAVAAAMASRNGDLIEFFIGEARSHLSAEALHAAQGAAAIMSMNNIWYRFPQLSGNPKYQGVPARLHMQITKDHGGQPTDFELWCLAVSAINGSSPCVASQEAMLQENGVAPDTVLAVVRIAAVVHGLAVVMDAELVSPAVPTVW